MRDCPLPAREGISPQRVMLSGVVPDCPEYVAGRAGDSPFAFGEAIPAGTVLERPVLAWFHPVVPPEPTIPFQEVIVDELPGLVVVAKPGFVPSTSNGRIQRETVQTRLRIRLRNDAIVPLHRLDRMTSGLLACSSDPATRGFYQQQFAQRTVRKRYHALLTRPLAGFAEWQTVSVPMRKQPGKRAVEVGSGTMTVTRVRTVGGRLVELEPQTGFTHQLRALCAFLGAPIEGDDTYPIAGKLQLYNYSEQLKLCASQLELGIYPNYEPKVWTMPQLADPGFWQVG
ncbi:pseudouridine synthase [Corynebacterium sp. H128]|uniref:pseudouridine synthase n=1 Tax=unclassified Corynebacterium TaxID=2624378 RepID=UPI0030B0C8A1